MIRTIIMIYLITRKNPELYHEWVSTWVVAFKKYMYRGIANRFVMQKSSKAMERSKIEEEKYVFKILILPLKDGVGMNKPFVKLVLSN